MTYIKTKAVLITGLIASKNPVESLVQTVASLFEGGASKVIVVDDGSDEPDSILVFEKVESLGATVLHLPENVGKAAALKAGFALVPVGSAIAQTDDDTLAGNLRIPLEMLTKDKADIVDIRVETNRAKGPLGLIQQLDYWMINAFIKRGHNLFRARLWMSGASVMYSYEAGRTILLPRALTVTEDTEGMFRARTKGMRVRFCSKKEAQFITMVPETFAGLHRQWKRWAIGNGQVIGIYGLGGGLKRVSFMNTFAWFVLVIVPVPAIIIGGLIPSIEWLLAFSFIVSVLGAISLRRFAVIFVFMLLPVISIAWIIEAIIGIFRAHKEPQSAGHLTWVSPERTAF